MALLESIRGPEDVRRLTRDQLPLLADEVRQRLIDVVSQTGGHIGAGLGVVELTVALCYCFESPADKVVWDVGRLPLEDPHRPRRAAAHAAPARRPVGIPAALREPA